MRRFIVTVKIKAIHLATSFANALRTSRLPVFRLLYVLVNKCLCLFFHVSSFRVLSHEMYIKLFNKGKRRVIVNNRVGYSSNLVYNNSNDRQQLFEYPLEDICLFHYDNLIISGDSDLLIDFDNNTIINNLCYNKDNRIIYHDSIMLNQRENTLLVRYSKSAQTIESGIVMSGLFSNNYYHSLYDNLVRMMILDYLDIPYDVPLLIDRATYCIPSLKSAFDCLNKPHKRVFIIIDSRTQYMVKSLYYITHINYMIPSIWSYDLCRPNDTVFDLNLMLQMREVLLSIKSNHIFPQKIFISRKHTSRRNFNEDEVFEALKNEGFVRVCPEDLSLEDQISLFNNANFIVGGGGAALTNLLFCNKGCKVLVINKTIDQVPCFTTIPYALGVKILHYGCNNNDVRLHSDYLVDPKKVIYYLRLLNESDYE